MKAKKWIAMLLALVMMLALVACNKAEPEEAENKYNVDIVDPEGLEYDTRIILYGNSENPTVQSYSQLGINISEQYVVIYGKDGVAIAQTDYYIFADTDSATTYQGLMPTLEVDGVNGICQIDAATIDVTLQSMVDAGMLTSKTLQDYIDLYTLAYGYTEVE